MFMDNVIDTKEKGDKAFFSDRFVAFLDVLGFGRLVYKNDHQTLKFIYETLINEPINSYNRFKSMEVEQQKREYGEYFEPVGLRVVNISNSILLWTDNSKQIALIELLYAVKLFLSISMKLGVPLRGAVSKGKIEVYENNGSISVVGRPIVQAVDYEKRQKWSGCIVEYGIVNYLRSFEKVVLQRSTPPLIDRVPNLLVPYTDVPIDGLNKNGFAVNWYSDDLTEEKIKKSFEAYNKGPVEGDNIIKVDNTIKFYNYCKGLAK